MEHHDFTYRPHPYRWRRAPFCTLDTMIGTQSKKIKNIETVSGCYGKLGAYGPHDGRLVGLRRSIRGELKRGTRIIKRNALPIAC